MPASGQRSDPGRGDPGQPTDDRAADCIDTAVWFLATQPGGVDRVLARHRRRRNGACSGCSYRPVTWPCSVANIALLAKAQQDRMPT